MNGLIQNVKEVEYRSSEVEKKLRQIVSRAVKANRKREIWGDAAYFAAQALYALFEGYPCPDNEDNNALSDPKPFMT